MTFQITDLIRLAVSSSDKSELLPVIIISVIIFIAVSVISGISAYRLKIRKIRRNQENDNKNIQR